MEIIINRNIENRVNDIKYLLILGQLKNYIKFNY